MTPHDARAPRADASRNRTLLLDAATRIFAATESEPSLREIAREAGVGIATLYRHFPTRESLVAAVYGDQLDRLTTGADALLSERPPSEALRAWMDLFGTWVATKKGMLGPLLSMIETGEIAHEQAHNALISAITDMLAAGDTAGDLRGDVSAEDVAAALIGTFTVAPLPDHAARAERLLDILLDGLRPRP